MANEVKLTGRSLKRLREIINGDSRDGVEILSQYRSGPDLVGLFNGYGQTDEYGDGFPSRWMYTDGCLFFINGTKDLRLLIEEVLDPLEFKDPNAHQETVEYLNPALERDGYRLVTEGGRTRIVSTTNAPGVSIDKHFEQHAASKEFVDEHLRKCRAKLSDNDFSGAITNARSLVEAVLVDLESTLEASSQKYDGNLPKLQKRVHKLLGRGKNAESDSVIQFLRGLEGLVSGLAGTSNTMGDRHSGATLRAERRHARLAVNCAFALCDFYVEALQAFHAKP